jgi:hypothetical protein
MPNGTRTCPDAFACCTVKAPPFALMRVPQTGPLGVLMLIRAGGWAGLGGAHHQVPIAATKSRSDPAISSLQRQPQPGDGGEQPAERQDGECDQPAGRDVAGRARPLQQEPSSGQGDESGQPGAPFLGRRLGGRQALVAELLPPGLILHALRRRTGRWLAVLRRCRGH